MNPKPALILKSMKLLKLRLVKLLQLLRDSETLSKGIKRLRDSEQSPAEPKTYACTGINEIACAYINNAASACRLRPKPSAALKLDN